MHDIARPGLSLMGNSGRALRRWAWNVVIAVAAAVSVNVAAGLVGPWGDTWSANPIGALVVGTWLDFAYLFVLPVSVLLVAMEYLGPRARRPRVVAIGAGAAVGFAYVLFILAVASGLFAGVPGTAIVAAVALFVLIGAAYGAIVRLPTRRVT